MLWEGFSGEREDPSSFSLRSVEVERCGSICQKLRKPAIVYILVGVASVAKCWRQTPPNLAIAGSCSFSEYFPSSYINYAVVNG